MALPEEIYSAAQVRQMEAAAVADGTPGYTLMQRAGAADESSPVGVVDSQPSKRIPEHRSAPTEAMGADRFLSAEVAGFEPARGVCPQPA